MSLDTVQVTISANPQTAAVAGFGTALILAKNAVSPGVVVYESADAVSLAGYAANSPVRLMVNAMFAQPRRPSRVKVAGLTSVVPWTARITTILPSVGDAVSMDVVLPNGTIRTATYTVIGGDTANSVAAGLGAALAAFAEFSVTLAPGQPYFDFQASAGTTKFRVSRLSTGVSYLDTEAASGYATRLSEIALVDPDFYGVLIDSTSDANITDLATWVTANKRIMFALTQNTREANTNGGPLGVALRDATIDRGELRYSGTGARADAAMAGVVLASTWDDGTAPTWAYRSLVTIPVDPLTPTQVNNLTSTVNTSIYVRERGANITWQGKAPSGKYADFVVFLDWLDARISESVFNLLLREPRLAYTSEGIGKVGDAVYDVLRVAKDRKAVSPDYPLTITLPKPADATTQERSGRILGGGGVRFEFVFAGAIHKVQVNGIVTL